MKEKYTQINARTIDRWVAEGWEWGKPISHRTFVQARKGIWSIFLTPNVPVPHRWFPPVTRGLKVLGLASGGGQQMPVLTALGFDCTVLDLSRRQLESEAAVAEREGYDIRIVAGDMTEPLPFAAGEFDLIVNPVSNCYIKDLAPLWAECRRVLKPKGLLMVGFDSGLNYAVSADEKHLVHSLPFDPLSQPALLAELKEGDNGIQFSHTMAEEIGGQLKAGFALVDIYEDTNASGHLRNLSIPTFVATLAQRKD